MNWVTLKDITSTVGGALDTGVMVVGNYDELEVFTGTTGAAGGALSVLEVDDAGVETQLTGETTGLAGTKNITHLGGGATVSVQNGPVFRSIPYVPKKLKVTLGAAAGATQRIRVRGRKRGT